MPPDSAPGSRDEGVRAPHAPLTDYYSEERERAAFVGALFDNTASDYDRVERLLALGSGRWYRRQALLRAGLAPGMQVVDVGVGTGMVACEAANIVGDARAVTGVDPSPGMMANARLPEGVTLLTGRAESLPLPDASVDFVSMGYALRHIGDLSAAFREFHRVLKPGGRVCVLEITRPENRIVRAFLKFYMRGVVPVVARAAGASAETAKLWRYYWDTVDACVPPCRVLATLEAAGFTGVRRHIDVKPLGIFSEYQGAKA